MRKLAVVIVIVVIGLAALTACSKKKKNGNTTACSSPPASIAAPGGLAAGFPKPDAVVYTGSSVAGPSTIVDGYATGTVTDLYNGYATDLGKAPYAITKKEHDAHDAEVTFARNGTTGQVKLGEACKDRVSVKVTVRPA
jgi:hypothetical protein